MKASNIVKFIFSILIGLAILCLVFPKKGIHLGGMHLKFPTLKEALTPTGKSAHDGASDLNPDELIDKELKAIEEMTAKRDSAFDVYAQTSPTRLFMPKQDSLYLDPFFAVLDSASSRVIRILHYGDSQLEGDRMTCYIRERFQKEYGGRGVGIVTPTPITNSFTSKQTFTPSKLRHYQCFGSTSFAGPDDNYGPMAVVTKVDSVADFTIALSSKLYPHCETFTRFSVAMQGWGTITAIAGNDTIVMHQLLDNKPQSDTIKLENGSDSIVTRFDTIDDSQRMRLCRLLLQNPVSEVELKVRGRMNLYGFMMDDTIGIAMDNIPMRGSSGTMFTKINYPSIAPFFAQEDVRLIILQYGGNSVPYINNTGKIEFYCNELRKQIQHLKRLAPKARFIFIGPADMSTSIEGEMQSYPHLPAFVKALQEMTNEEGIAFWDMYTAMGGWNSMIHWVEARPQLAGEDYIHFTPKGADRISRLFYETLDLYFKDYKHRYGKNVTTTVQDTDEKRDATKHQ